MKQWALIATISILPVAPTSVPLPLGPTCTEDRGLFLCPGSDVGTSKEASKEACARRCYDNPACESWLYERPNIATNPNQYTDCKLKGAARCTRRQNTDNTASCTWVLGSRHCGKGSKPTTLKGQGWEDGRSVGLGYLWFEKEAHLTHPEAVKFCEKKHSHLIEIDSQAQLDYVVNTLKIFSKNVNVWKGYWKGWWGGASDKDSEGSWVWERSGTPVQGFVWGTNQPNSHGHEDNFSFLDWNGFKGNDVAGTHLMYPLCQYKEGWEDGRSVGLGFLWFEKEAQLTHPEAVRFCEKKNSHLIEIDSQAQLDYVVNTLKIISKNVRVFPLGFSHAKGWWGGATDEDKEGTWLWEESRAPVQSFVWATNPQQPNSHGDEDNFSFLDWSGFKGHDVAGTHKMYPLCQYKEEWEDGRNGGEVSNFCRCPIIYYLNIFIHLH